MKRTVKRRSKIQRELIYLIPENRDQVYELSRDQVYELSQDQVYELKTYF